MKKVLFAAAIAVLSIAGVQAQTSTTPITPATPAKVSTTAKVNVVLNPAFSIEVDNSTLDKTDDGLAEAKAVNLVYRTAEDYSRGVRKAIPNHLKVTSVGTGYKIYASAETATLKKTAGVSSAVDEMEGDVVFVKVGGQGKGLTIAELNSKAGQTANGKNNTSAKGEVVYTLGNSNSTASVVGQGLGVEYYARPLKDAEVRKFLGENNSVGSRYTVNVTYYIIAD